MTGAPGTEPTSTGRWRQRAIRGLTTTRDASLRSLRGVQRGWDRMLTSLQDDPPARLDPTPPPPGPLVEQRDVPGMIVVPARGYVYHFQLHVTFAWSSSTSLRAEVLSWYAQYFTPHAVQRLTRLATDAARDLAPHQAAELETQLLRTFAEQAPWTYRRGDVEVTCAPDVSVRLEERIRRRLQPHVDRLVALDCELEEHLRRARHAEQLSRRWVAILNDHLDADDDEDLAEARDFLLSRQRDAARWVEDLLTRSRRPHPGPLATPTVPPQPSADR
ncbi:hypothetical protein [Micromonospora sp. WMMD812]|uniref:hypothetical protein n=1 Tax=Micromonospora sp. WMMD812 TaxID=3015152 RepID=UPI00248AB050|nr:hypothetical protein [Micromonospora sp. WMMD812]WBB68150.1 hypothetical protein O7603_01865 [Micromonospora sp. WMMD812]